jgi:hypothetical protein
MAAGYAFGPTRPTGLLLPVFALISSLLFLGDRVAPKLSVGGLLAISGVALVTRLWLAPRPESRRPATSPVGYEQHLHPCRCGIDALDVPHQIGATVTKQCLRTLAVRYSGNQNRRAGR